MRFFWRKFGVVLLLSLLNVTLNPVIPGNEESHSGFGTDWRHSL